MVNKVINVLSKLVNSSNESKNLSEDMTAKEAAVEKKIINILKHFELIKPGMVVNKNSILMDITGYSERRYELLKQSVNCANAGEDVLQKKKIFELKHQEFISKQLLKYHRIVSLKYCMIDDEEYVAPIVDKIRQAEKEINRVFGLNNQEWLIEPCCVNDLVQYVLNYKQEWMLKGDILDAIKRVFKYSKYDIRTLVSPDDDLRDDLGLDSMQLVDLELDFKEISMPFTLEDYYKIKRFKGGDNYVTVLDCVNIIYKNWGKR